MLNVKTVKQSENNRQKFEEIPYSEISVARCGEDCETFTNCYFVNKASFHKT